MWFLNGTVTCCQITPTCGVRFSVMQQWLQTFIMPIIQHSSGELSSLVNFEFIYQFSLTDYLTFNSGTEGTKIPNVPFRMASAPPCCALFPWLLLARRLHNPFNLFLCTAESVDTHFPHEAWKSHPPWLNRPAWGLFPPRDFKKQWMPAEDLYHEELIISAGDLLRTSFFTAQGYEDFLIWISCQVTLYKTQIALISSTFCCVLIWALTAVFIWGRKRQLSNGGLEQGIVWFDGISACGWCLIHSSWQTRQL